MNRFLFWGIACMALVGCTEHSAAPPAVVEQATPVVFNSAGLPTVEFNAPDMMCPEGCGEKVKEILSGQPGAKEVVVDFEAKKAKVAVEDSGKFDKQAAVAALVDHGFANSSVVGDEAAGAPKPDAPVDKAKDDSAG